MKGASKLRQMFWILYAVLNFSNMGGSGSVYIRWGRTVCPAGSELVYDGNAGGSAHDDEGGMSEYLCLPKSPQFHKYEKGFQHASRLFGAEYQLESRTEILLEVENNNQESQHQSDVPCSVCQVKRRESVMMFPALVDCPDKWRKEYHGYFMALVSTIKVNKQNKKPVCMDKSPETVPKSKASKNGALFYFVKAMCGSLPCGPYVEGREITCVVCTR